MNDGKEHIVEVKIEAVATDTGSEPERAELHRMADTLTEEKQPSIVIKHDRKDLTPRGLTIKYRDTSAEPFSDLYKGYLHASMELCWDAEESISDDDFIDQMRKENIHDFYIGLMSYYRTTAIKLGRKHPDQLLELLEESKREINALLTAQRVLHRQNDALDKWALPSDCAEAVGDMIEDPGYNKDTLRRKIQEILRRKNCEKKDSGGIGIFYRIADIADAIAECEPCFTVAQYMKEFEPFACTSDNLHRRKNPMVNNQIKKPDKSRIL